MREQRFRQPGPIAELPAPIQAFRWAAGTWLGESRSLSGRKVTGMTVRKTADGPVFVEVAIEYTFANGGYYRATIQVVDRVPLAKVVEEYDARPIPTASRGSASSRCTPASGAK